MQGRSQNTGATDRPGNYPHPEEPAWTRIERHKNRYLTPTVTYQG